MGQLSRMFRKLSDNGRARQRYSSVLFSTGYSIHFHAGSYGHSGR